MKIISFFFASLLFSVFAFSSTLPRPYSKVKWFFQCPSNPFTVPAPGTEELVVVDQGPLKVDREDLTDTKFEISGRVCKPQALKRDMIFVIDVSGSMGTNDTPNPFTKTCGRLKAINSVLDTLDWNISSVGIVTFDDAKQATSDKLYSVKADLIKQIVTDTAHPNQILYDIVCAVKGSTNYLPPLTRATELLQMGREDATKEIFFLSDGEPFDANDAVPYATNLKDVGVTVGSKTIPVTIASVMLKGSSGNESTMQDIASKDLNGNPIYANADDSSQLNEILNRFARNDLAGARLRYKSDSNSNWQTIDIFGLLDANYNFVIPPFTLDINGDQTGYQFNFESFNYRNTGLRTTGDIIWTD